MRRARVDNPACEANVERLIDAARGRGDAVVFVRHDSSEPDSPLRPGRPGNDLLGGNLGYDVRFVLDATHTFDRGGVPAAELSRIAGINLDGEFATVVSTDDVV